MFCNLTTASALSPPFISLPRRPVDYVRLSRGNPSFAKPVAIPVVPSIPRPDLPGRRDSNNGVPPEQVSMQARPWRCRNDLLPPLAKWRPLRFGGTKFPLITSCSVLPQINNFVYETSPNNVVLDLNDLSLDAASSSNLINNNNGGLNGQGGDLGGSSRASSPDSHRSSRSNILSKVNRVKRSIAHKSATLTRRKRKSGDAASTASTRNSMSNLAMTSSMYETSTTTTTRPSPAPPTILPTAAKIVKPSVAPPPPPTAVVAPMKKSDLPTKVPSPPCVTKQSQQRLLPPLPPARKSSASANPEAKKEEAAKGEDLETTDLVKASENGTTKPEDLEDMDDFKVDLTTTAEVGGNCRRKSEIRCSISNGFFNPLYCPIAL